LDGLIVYLGPRKRWEGVQRDTLQLIGIQGRRRWAEEIEEWEAPFEGAQGCSTIQGWNCLTVNVYFCNYYVWVCELC
jgi:hypothetical protein